MAVGILLTAVVVVMCVLLNKVSQKMGLPMLLAFILLGMLFGNEGILRIPFENYFISEQICSVALIFIMFYGGFGTNWDQARPVAVKAGLLSTLGVLATALLTGAFCHYGLGMERMESLLIGAVISSTDAASVFSILRSKKLGLKEHTDSMLEIESGSNDPCSYMMTSIVLSAMGGEIAAGSIAATIALQLLFGVAVGVAVAVGAGVILRKFHFETAGFDMAFVVGVSLLSYALAAVLGGNGYLSAYICGLILGNIKIQNKKALVHFFDGTTGLMQMLIFFLLGLLATPSRIVMVLTPAVCIMVFLTLIARPAAVFAILTPFRCSVRQQVLVSFAGLRGAASIVFAIMAMVSHSGLYYDLFHIVFCIVLLSIGVQGSLLPLVSRWLDMSDQSIDVMKTFNDYEEAVDLRFIKVQIRPNHLWAGKMLMEIVLPPDTLVTMILREGVYFVPDGKTTLLPEDIVVLSAHQFDDGHTLSLREQTIGAESKWIGKTISDFSPHSNELVILIMRKETTVIPTGTTVIACDDILVINSAVDHPDEGLLIQRK